MASKETIMYIPMEYIKGSTGFGIDIGGSVSKLVYRSKEDFKNGQPLKGGDGKLGPVRMVTVPKANIDDVIHTLADRCDYVNDGSKMAFTTGFGANFYKKQIQEGLRVKTTNISEFESFVNVANILGKQMQKSELILPISEEAIKEGLEIAKIGDIEGQRGQRPKLSAAEKKKLTEELESKKRDKIEFPFLMALCGSGFLFLKVYDDSTYELLEFAAIGGRAFLGLSRALTGADDYEGLWELIESSDGSSVDIKGKDLVTKDKSDESEDDLYSHVPPEIIIFSFGKGWTAPKDSVGKGDMLWSLARMFSNQLATQAWNVAKSQNIKDVLFCGNFVTPNLIQNWITSEATYRRDMAKSRGRVEAERSPDINFLKNGGFFGALGCFLYDQSVEPEITLL